MWHLNLLCPALPPLRSARPAAPPPLLVVASATLRLISAVVCFVGLALPPMASHARATASHAVDWAAAVVKVRAHTPAGEGPQTDESANVDR